MKKVMMIAAFAAALVSCQSKGNQNNNTLLLRIRKILRPIQIRMKNIVFFLKNQKMPFSLLKIKYL